MKRGLLGCLLGLLAFGWVGCGPRSPLDRKLETASGLQFTQWRARLARAWTPAEDRHFEQALQEVRVYITSRGIASGSDPVAAALREQLAGLTVREVLQLGGEIRLQRLEAEHAALAEVLQMNSLLQTREGDTASERHLVDVHRRQMSRLEKLETEIGATRAELTQLRAATGRPQVLPEPEDELPTVRLERPKYRA